MSNYKTKIDHDMNDLINDPSLLADIVSLNLIENFSRESVSKQLNIHLSKLSWEERINLASDIESEKIFVGSSIFRDSDEMKDLFSFYESGLSDLIKSAAIHEVMGFERLAKQLRIRYAKLFTEIMYQSIRSDTVEKEIISNVNKVKASKPRNSYYDEVMAVIKLTWEKYPCASKTGLINALCFHYHEKVSRNTLSNWVSKSGMQPDRPKKYLSFELVFPK